jgi:6-pyruvoyltetrahydropterin/6-carboxytetrahydropterin synthase
MFELSVDTHFDAAHFLRGYPGDCGRLHGHTWKVTVTVSARGNLTLGMAVDFKDIARTLDLVVSEFDHRNLNDLRCFEDENPTAENIAILIFDRIEKEFPEGTAVIAVTVAESDRFRVTYRGDDRNE